MTTEPFEPTAPEPDPLPEADPRPAPVAGTTAVRPGLPAAHGKAGASSRLLVNGILAVAFAVLIGGVGFAVGRATTPPTVTTPGGDSALQGGFGARDGGAGQFPGDDDAFRLRGSASIEGTVVSVSSSSMTLKLSDGRTVTVAITASTGYHRQADASASDVTTGSKVIVGVAGLGPDSQGSGPTAGSITIVP